MSEHDEQATFFTMAGYLQEKYPQLCWMHAIPNGGARNVVVARKMKCEGVVRGIADVFLPYPRNGYHGLYIEFKYGKNRLTSEQREFLDYANINGYKTGVAYSAEAGIEILRAYLGDDLSEAVEVVRKALEKK